MTLTPSPLLKIPGIYIAIDGDHVGHRLEYYILANDEESLTKFSSEFSMAMEWLKNYIDAHFSGTLLFSGGDNMLVIVSPDFDPNTLESLRNDFYLKSQRTLSIGIGHTPRESLIALKFAKAKGKNLVVSFKDLPV